MTWLNGRKSIGIKCGEMTKLLRRYDWFNKDIGYFKTLWLFSTNAIAAVYPALRKGIECFRILKITVFSQIYYARTITSIKQQRYFQSSSIKTRFLFKRFVFVQVVQVVQVLQVSKNSKRFNNVKNISMKSCLCKLLRTDIDVYQSWFHIENLFDQRKEKPYW